MANAIILPMAFISDIFIAIEDPPTWLATLGDILPLKPFAQSFQDAFNPAVDRRRRSSGASWRSSPPGASLGLLVALRWFKWEPSNGGIDAAAVGHGWRPLSNRA